MLDFILKGGIAMTIYFKVFNMMMMCCMYMCGYDMVGASM